MVLDQPEVQRETHLFLDHLEKLVEENPEIGDVHEAFERYSMNKYSIGDASSCKWTAGKNDCGIDFYSCNNASYHIAQCKIPARDWLEAHPSKIKFVSGLSN